MSNRPGHVIKLPNLTTHTAMSAQKTSFQKLLLAMQCASGNPQPFVTREDLAAFGAALLEALAPSAKPMAEQEYCTLSYLARRFQCSRDYMAVRLAHPSIRKIQLPGGKRVKYHIEDAINFLSSSQNLHPVYNS